MRRTDWGGWNLLDNLALLDFRNNKRHGWIDLLLLILTGGERICTENPASVRLHRAGAFLSDISTGVRHREIRSRR